MAFEINVQTRRPAVNVEIPGSLVFGINGATFYPAVSEDGILSWTNDRGLPNPEPVKVSGKDGESGSPGNDGLPGEDGITPHVGSNGNWFLGSADTGVPATGPAGERGLPGIPGEDGKSAYAYAQEAGYTGTEADFAEKLAQEPSGSGIHIGTEAPTNPNVDVWIDTDEEAPENENGIDVIAEVGQTIVVEAVDADGKPTAWKAVDFPTALKNPYALTINGTSYDGSEEVNIESIKGDKGDTGQRGADGKSAYAYAQEAGYTGTEDEFAEKLAQEPLFGSTAEITPAQVAEALEAGRDISLTHTDSNTGTITFNQFVFVAAYDMVLASAVVHLLGKVATIALYGFKSGSSWTMSSTQLAQNSDVPAPVIGSTEEITPAQVADAVSNGRNVILTHMDGTYGAITFNNFIYIPALGVVISSAIVYFAGDYLVMELIGSTRDGSWAALSKEVATVDDIPESLKNPYALTINGISYDGSTAVNIESIKGDTGQRGTGLLAVTSAPSSYTTAVGGITPKYRMALSTIKTQSGVTEVFLGDTVRYSYYHYPIAYLDGSYAYFTTRVSIRGASGSAGAAGAPGAAGADGKSAYAYAQDGGYTGTEAEFAEKLAEEYTGISWSETGEVVLLPETECIFLNKQSMCAGYLEIVPGNTYTVSFDGTKYQCVAFETQYPGSSYYFPVYCFGNAAIAGAGDNTGEPFLFCSAPTANCVMVIATDTKAVHTVGVTYTGTKYVPIPDDCIQKDYIVNITQVADNVYLADKTAKEAAQAALSGKNVYAIHRSDASNGNAYRRYTLCYMITQEPEDAKGERYLVKFIGLDLDDMMLLTMSMNTDGIETITIAAVTI